MNLTLVVSLFLKIKITFIGTRILKMTLTYVIKLPLDVTLTLVGTLTDENKNDMKGYTHSCRTMMMTMMKEMTIIMMKTRTYTSKRVEPGKFKHTIHVCIQDLTYVIINILSTQEAIPKWNTYPINTINITRAETFRIHKF